MTGFQIEHRHIGPTQPTFVIAEIGVNHDGSVHRAIELVRTAAACGADAIKLQLFSADRLVSADATCAGYQKQTTSAASQRELLRKYELSEEAVERIIDAARVAGVIPLATPFSPEDVFVIEHLGLGAIKIASPDLINQPLLRRASKSKSPIIVSTGASRTDEIDRASAWLRGWEVPFALMHCVSSYPTPAEQMHLATIDAMRRRYDVPIGYSDHSTHELAGAFAVSAGACIVEKHLTYSRFASGPDHAASADPAQFELYIRSIRLAEQMRGTARTQPLECESDVRKLSRQSLVARSAIAAGERIQAEHLTVRRPADGISPDQADAVVGKIAAAPIPAETPLTWDLLRDVA